MTPLAPLILTASATLAVIAAAWIVSDRIAEAMNDRSDLHEFERGDCRLVDARNSHAAISTDGAQYDGI